MIDIQKINVGDTYTGYKNLCLVIDEPIKSGKSKRLQMNNWRRYFNWIEHTRYNWEITEIYDEPKPKIDRRVNNGGARTNIYADHIDYLILHECKAKYGFEKTIRQLAFDFDLVNEDFLDISYDIEYYADTLNITEYYISDFYSNAYERIRDMIVGSIERLAKKGCITYQVNRQYKHVDDKFAKPITPEIEEKIEKIERELLNQMGFSSIQAVNGSDRKDEFYNKKNKLLLKQFGIERSYKLYEVVLNPTNDLSMMDSIAEIEDKYGEDFGEAEHRRELNIKLRQRIIEWATKEHETMKQKYDALTSPDDPFADVDEKHKQVDDFKMDRRRKPEFVDAVKKCVDYFLVV